MAEFKTFMSMKTGKSGRYPAHYASRPSFIEVDPESAPCLDCLPDEMFVRPTDIPEPSDEDLLAQMYEDEDTETEEE